MPCLCTGPVVRREEAVVAARGGGNGLVIIQHHRRPFQRPLVYPTRRPPEDAVRMSRGRRPAGGSRRSRPGAAGMAYGMVGGRRHRPWCG